MGAGPHDWRAPAQARVEKGAAHASALGESPERTQPMPASSMKYHLRAGELPPQQCPCAEQPHAESHQ